LLGVMGVRLLMRLGARLLGPVLPLFIQAIVPADARVASITGIVSGVSAAAGAVGALGLGRLGDRVGYRGILVSCALVSVVCYVPQYFAGDPTALLFWQAGTGLAMGGILASLSASLARLSPEGQEGIVYGVDASVVSSANAIGPMTGSALAAWFGLRVPFLVAAGIFGLAGVAAARLLPGRSRRHGSDPLST
jgi:DHA1 family multidrug resistance protein-like MFS transporter